VYDEYYKITSDIGVEGISIIIADKVKPAAQCTKATSTAQTVLGQITHAFQYRDKSVFIQLNNMLDLT
jgi:hypothetical protein